MDLLKVAELAKTVGFDGVLLVVLLSILTKNPWWVPGWLYRQRCDECDVLKGIATKAVANNELLSETNERQAQELLAHLRGRR